MKRILLTIVFAVLTMNTTIFAQEKIAVFPFEDREKILTQNESFMLYDEFSNEFAYQSVGKFSVVERQDVERLISIEASFQLSDFSAMEKTAEMNSVLNGTHILSGNIGKLDNKIRVTVSLFTYPQLSRLPYGYTIEVSNKSEIFRKIPELVKEVQNRIASINTRPGANITGKIYKVGDTGPAGGIVFFDRGFYGDGWRYLEAAPIRSEWRYATWGTYQQNVTNTGRDIGFGKLNTQLIVEILNSRGEKNCAAQLCANLDINDYKDWFLPSLEELYLMYRNLRQKDMGVFSEAVYYSSSQSSSDTAWGIDFANGNYVTHRKHFQNVVRAIRAF